MAEVLGSRWPQPASIERFHANGSCDWRYETCGKLLECHGPHRGLRRYFCKSCRNCAFYMKTGGRK